MITICEWKETKCGAVHTFSVETLVQHLLNSLFGSFQSVFLPRFAVVRAQNDDFALLASKGGEMWNFDNHRAERIAELIQKTKFS